MTEKLEELKATVAKLQSLVIEAQAELHRYKSSSALIEEHIEAASLFAQLARSSLRFSMLERGALIEQAMVVGAASRGHAGRAGRFTTTVTDRRSIRRTEQP